MRKIFFLFLMVVSLFSFQNKQIENLMGSQKFQTYNELLPKIFVKQHYTIYQILNKLKNNGLLQLFFNKAKVINTIFIFKQGQDIFDGKILNDSLRSLGYYYFYPVETISDNKKFLINIEFKSEHFIDPVSLIDEMKTRGCKILDVNRTKDLFTYKFSCANGIVKESHLLTDRNKRYINTNGVYWLRVEENSFKSVKIYTKRIDYWHPSVWFYDDKLNLLNNIKINKKISRITLKIPAGCKYIKITDIYSGENFKRGIIVKGLK